VQHRDRVRPDRAVHGQRRFVRVGPDRARQRPPLPATRRRRRDARRRRRGAAVAARVRGVRPDPRHEHPQRGPTAGVSAVRRRTGRVRHGRGGGRAGAGNAAARRAAGAPAFTPSWAVTR
jgi:hypothetical protein